MERLFSATLVAWMDKKGYDFEARHLLLFTTGGMLVMRGDCQGYYVVSSIVISGVHFGRANSLVFR